MWKVIYNRPTLYYILIKPFIAAVLLCVAVIGNNKANCHEPSCCPVCGVCLQSGEFESHFLQELERLCKLTCARSNYETQRLPAPDHRWEVSNSF